jgi:hypothetical protein
MSRTTPWHWWYAWRPVRSIDGRLLWLRTIKRRQFYFPVGLPGAPGPMFEYATDEGYC